MYKGSIYAEINDKIVRYSLPSGALVPQGAAETVVSGLPLGGDHPMHPFFITSDGIPRPNRHRLRDQSLPAAKPAA